MGLLDTKAQEFQSELFARIERGLRGQGLDPNLQAQSIRDMIAATTEEFHATQRDLPGMLARTIPKADVGVRSFVRKSVDAAFARSKEGIRDEFAGRKFEEKGIAQNLAFQAVATERGVGSQITDLFNQSGLRRAMAPSFGSELAGGIGGTAGILAGGYRRPSTATTGMNTNLWQPITATPFQRQSSLFTPTGASSLSNQWLGSTSPAVSYSSAFSNLS